MVAAKLAFCAAILVTQRRPSRQSVIVAGSMTALLPGVVGRLMGVGLRWGLRRGSSVLSGSGCVWPLPLSAKLEAF